jgi:hypothetical protein
MGETLATNTAQHKADKSGHISMFRIELKLIISVPE